MTSKTILIFDVDGTLTKPRNKVEQWMTDYLSEVRKKCPVALVGGSDLAKVVEQMGDSLQDVAGRFDFVFTENGLVGFKDGKPLPTGSITDKVGDEKLQRFINYCFGYMSKIRLPVKRGNFFEFRRGMLNVSPVGRSCSQAEREQFAAFDKEHNIREKFVEDMRKNFPVEEFGLQFSIGGQISVDIFPIGWDKTYCLKFIQDAGFNQIHFFGDRTLPGGNDHEIYEDPRTIGHAVTSPQNTKAQVDAVLENLA